MQSLAELGLKLRYCLETHLHADHITGAGKLRQQTGAQVIVPQNTAVTKADRSLVGGEIVEVGSVIIETIFTPGHTASHMAYLVNKTHLLTGDALFIRGCGRTDFQGGDPGTLYDVVTQRLFTLPDDTLVYAILPMTIKGAQFPPLAKKSDLIPDLAIPTERFSTRRCANAIAIYLNQGKL